MRKRLIIFLGLLLFAGGSVHAQWMTQNISLQPGWNAVYVEPQPSPNACADIFTNTPVESVWKWDRRFSTIEYQLDPDTLEPRDPDWLVWLPPWSDKSFLSRLYVLQGGQSYLIKVATNAAPFVLPVKGRVMIPLAEWFPHSLNLLGFPLSSNNPPTFSSFFRFTPEVDTSRGQQNELYRVNTAGKGVRIVQPARDKMQAGTAYWVECASDPKYLCQIHVRAGQGSAVDFGAEGMTSDLEVQNVSTSDAVTVVIRQRASESPPSGNWPELAGTVALSYIAKNASNEWIWADFPGGGLTRTVGPKEKWLLRLGIRRADMPDYTPSGTNGARYQSILDVSDSAESLLIRVPVVAEKDPFTGLGPLGAHVEHEGLWVGAAILNQVNAPAYSGTNLLETGAAATMRLILHVDGYGNMRLLQHAILAWDAAFTNAPHTNGAFVVYTHEADVPADAASVSRISSTTLPLMDPLLLTGEFTNVLTCTVTNTYDDPVNPFLHRYHPLFDNKDGDFQPYNRPVETRGVWRYLTMDFTTITNAEPADPFWGVENVGGTYHEKIEGLRAQDIFVEGRFFLKRISRVNELK